MVSKLLRAARRFFLTLMAAGPCTSMLRFAMKGASAGDGSVRMAAAAPPTSRGSMKRARGPVPATGSEIFPVALASPALPSQLERYQFGFSVTTL